MDTSYYSFGQKLIKGTFIKRINRFTAEVSIKDEIQFVHVPSSGRMTELLTKGAGVYLRTGRPGNRKTKYDLLLVDYNGILVCIDSHLPNRFLYNEIKEKKLNLGLDFTQIYKEPLYKSSKFDIYLKGEINTFIEIKSVTLVEEGIAKFPDAPSQRGSRHLKELGEAILEGYNAMVIFFIQREDANIFQPNYGQDPYFAKSLKEAVLKGVSVISLKSKIRPDGIQIICKVPVIFD